MDIGKILRDTKSIAVVGISDKPDRDSGRIALFLKDRGYQVVGVHPQLNDVFGIPTYKSLKEIPHKIDLVNVFLSSDKVGQLTQDIIDLKPNIVWYQLSVRNDFEAERLSSAGIKIIQDRCIAIEYRKHLL